MATAALIVRATASHRDAAVELLGAQLNEHEIPIDDVSLHRAVDGVLADGGVGFFLIAEQEAQPIGIAYVSFMWSLEHGGLSSWLEELYVRPAHRGQGIGRAILLEALAEARAAGCAAMDLEVQVTHDRAAHLYEREGFGRLPRARWVRTLI